VAEDLASTESPTAPSEPRPARRLTPLRSKPEQPAEHRAGRPYRRRFVAFYAVLAAALGGTVAGVLVAHGTSSGRGGGSAAWSPWKPSGGGLGAAKQIAAHVGPEYRLPNGAQLVAPIPAPPVFSDGKTILPISVLALTGSQGKVRDLIQITGTDTIMYSMCGLGRLCAIASGTPSVARGALVRREILELALYTFEYLPGVKNVVAFQPPVSGTRTAVYLQRSDLEPELRKPLAATLEPAAPTLSSIVARTREVTTIRRIVLPRLYSTNPTPTQQGEGVLVLRALPAS
jgi:hypothetical protein